MVAAHAYDLRAAKKVCVCVLREPFSKYFLFLHLLLIRLCSSRGMKTVYIRRDTEDVDEDMDRIRKEVDVFLEGSADDRGPMEKLADLLL